MRETKISDKAVFEYFGNGILGFLGILFYSEEFGTQKVGGRYYKVWLNGSEGINKIFGVGIFQILLAAKVEGNCI